LGIQKGFLVVDLSKIIIEPDEIGEYSRIVKSIMDTYLYPNGIARYGFDIGRITIRLSHASFLDGDPNLFNTREEAIRYIILLAKKYLSNPLPTSTKGFTRMK